jgi:hypothetical protein
MKFNFVQAVVLAALPVIAFGSIVPAFAQKVVQPSQVACRRVIDIVGGPEQPRAVAGVYGNQVPLYTSPADIYGGSPASVVSIGDTVFLSQPQEVQFVNDPSDQNGFGVQMIAIDTSQGQRWMPVADVALAGGRDGSKNYSTLSKSNLGYCGIRGMW